jgi:hypothetical protein
MEGCSSYERVVEGKLVPVIAFCFSIMTFFVENHILILFCLCDIVPQNDIVSQARA